MMVSRRRLEDGDFEAWKVRFEQGAADRRRAGCRGVRRFVGIEDRHELMVIFDWDTLENARAFINAKMASNARLSESRAEAGPKLWTIPMEELPPLES
jgi:heme-degrading monooxygenase HmoA